MVVGNSGEMRRNSQMASIVEHGVMLQETVGKLVAISYLQRFEVPPTVIDRVLGQGRRRTVTGRGTR